MKSYHDIPGDGGSRIVEQVVEQRSRIERSLAGVRHVVAVGSGKGGVGKSTLTREIAAALHANNRRVAILDADLNGPSQARLAGLSSAPLIPGERGLMLPLGRHGIGVASLGALVPESQAVDFETVAEGDSHVWRATREFAFLGQLLSAVDWGRLDVLFVDLPPGAERTFQYAEFLGPRAAFVLVTIPSALSRGVVARSVAALRKTSNSLLGYIENMSGYYCAGCHQVKPLFGDASGGELDLPRLGSVPFDPILGSDGPAAESDRPCIVAVREAAKKIFEALEAKR